MTSDHLVLLVVILAGYLVAGFIVALGFCRAAAMGDPDLDPPRVTGQDDDTDAVLRDCRVLSDASARDSANVLAGLGEDGEP